MITPVCYGVDLTGRALASDKAVWIDDVCLDDNFTRAAAAKVSHVHAAFSFPVTLHGKIQRVFEFFAYEPRKQDPNLFLMINILKNQMGQFLEYQVSQEHNKNLAFRFKFAVASGKIGVWEYDSITKKLIWDKQMYQLYGIDPKVKNIGYLTWKSALHPDDAKKAADELEQAILDKKAFNTMFRIVKPNGEIRHIRANATVIPSADGSRKIMMGLNRDITKEKELTEKLKQLNNTLAQHAYYDSLTGLMNRHALENEASRIFSLGKRHHYQIGILFIDLDNFKTVNDQFGHTVGDELLIEVAKRLTQALRKEDAACRIGGDEFSVLLNNIKNTDAAVVIAKKIIASMGQPFHLTPHEIHIGASIGVSIYPESGKTFANLLNKADAALLQAKNTGKGCVRIFKEASPLG